MKILVVYATTDGQTRKIARFAADRLAEAGHTVELVSARDAEGVGPKRFDAAILAGSVHLKAYQPELVGFARGVADTLNAMPTMFISVSLSAAGDDPEDWAGLEACDLQFSSATGWHPKRIEHVAGAFRFTQYDFFRAWAMRWIAQAKGEEVHPNKDREYTDWMKLGAALEEWAGALG